MHLIFRFALEVDGKIYLAEIQEKDEAWKTYKEAKEQGKSAGKKTTLAFDSLVALYILSTGFF